MLPCVHRTQEPENITEVMLLPVLPSVISGFKNISNALGNYCAIHAYMPIWKKVCTSIATEISNLLTKADLVPDLNLEALNLHWRMVKKSTDNEMEKEFESRVLKGRNMNWYTQSTWKWVCKSYRQIKNPFAFLFELVVWTANDKSRGCDGLAVVSWPQFWRNPNTAHQTRPKTRISPCIMCVQYRGTAQYCGGESWVPWEVFNTVGAYLEYHGRCSVP